MSSILIAAASTGGRFIPVKASISAISKGVCRIDNYNPNFAYEISTTSGSISVSSNIITTSGTENTIVTVVATSPKGGRATSGSYERKKYTFYRENRRYSTCTGGGCYAACEGPGSPCGTPCCCWGGSPGAGGWICCFPCTTVWYDNWVDVKSATPTGYTDVYDEWIKIL